jgi:hypothetical protein
MSFRPRFLAANCPTLTIDVGLLGIYSVILAEHGS